MRSTTTASILKLRIRPRRSAMLALGAALFLTLPSVPVHADDTWIGGGSDNKWSTAGNWNNGTPSLGNFNILSFSSTSNSPSNDDIVSLNGNELLFNTAGSFTINGSGTLNLYDNGGMQAKIENNGSSASGLFTLNTATISFAANNGSPPNPFGEINAVSGDILFGAQNTLNVNGSSVNGIKMYGSGHTTTFNNTVNASGKYFGTTATNDIVAIGGAFTSGDFYLMNNGTLNLNSGGTLTTSALRLGGDFGNTGNQNQTLGAAFNLAATTGGQNFASIINTVPGNTSGALIVNSSNASGTNTVSGNVYLDSALTIKNTASGTLAVNGTTDVKAQTLTFSAGGTISVSGQISSSTGGGSLVSNGTGTVILMSASADTYTGGTTVNSGTMSGNAASFGSGAVTVAQGATVDYTQGGTGTAANYISGTGTASFGGNAMPGANGSGGTISYTGQDSAAQTNVQSGTVVLNHSGGPAVIGPVAVATGATLQLGADNQIATAAPGSTNPAAVTLNGGTLNASGHNDGSIGGADPTTAAVTSSMGALSLGNTSMLDFGLTQTGSGPFVLAFADSSATLGGGNLNVIDYTGGTDALYIGTSNDLSSSQLQQIAINGMGVTQLTNGEIVPAAAPEPSQWAAFGLGTFGLGALALRARRRAAQSVTA